MTPSGCMHLAGYLPGIMGISTSRKALGGGLYQIQSCVLSAPPCSRGGLGFRV